MAQTLRDVFTEHRIAIFGDSISTFEGMIPSENAWYYGKTAPEITGKTNVCCPQDTWWMQAIDGLSGVLHANASYSGSMVAGEGFPAGCSQKRAAQILAADGEAPDDVLIFIGINDYGWGSAQAQAAGRSAATPACVDLASIPEGEPSYAPADTLTRFQDAYEEMLGNIKVVAPAAHIWCITLLPGRLGMQPNNTFCYSLRGIALADYNEAIRAAAANRGCFVADIATQGLDYESAEGTHPTAVGMTQLAALVIRAMEQAACETGLLGAFETEVATGLSAEGADELFPPALRSRRTCELPDCIGCTYAQGTGSQWSCVCRRDLVEI